MKSSILFAVGFALAWVAMTPATCRALAEIAPDHFEMENVEPVSQTTNALAVNGKPAQIRIGDEWRGNSIHNCANRKAPGDDKAKGWSAIAISSCRSGASQSPKPVQASERIEKKARAKVNSSSSGGEAKVRREVLQPKP